VAGEQKRQVVRLIADGAVICGAVLVLVWLKPVNWQRLRHADWQSLRHADSLSLLHVTWVFFAAIMAFLFGLAHLLFPMFERWRVRRRPPQVDWSHAGKIMKAWRTILSLVADGHTRNLVGAFLTTYADSEVDAILGKLKEEEGGTTAGRKHVVTSFLTYSALVTAVVAQAKKEYHDPGIVCFTTLPMPLSRWFNYHTRLGDDRVEAIEVDDKWEHYKRTIRKLLNENDIDFRRCLIATDKEYAALTDLAIKTKADVQKQANYSILVPHDGAPASPIDWSKLRPYTWNELATLLQNGNEAVQTLHAKFEATYKGRRDRYGAYVIHEESHEVLPAIPKHMWQPLGLAFEASAHRLPSECRFHSFDHTGVRQWFSCTDPADQVPEDIFGVGVKGPSGDPEWKFFFGGDVGQEIARVTLEFVVAGEQKHNHRYDRFRDFANEVWNTAKLGEAF